MAIELAVCAYCGVYTPTEPEHVVPRSFAPKNLRNSCRWVIVRGCSKCNGGFSADESDFRGFCVLADSPGPNPVKDALFHGAVTRNWQQADDKGTGALRRTLAQIRKPDGSGLTDLSDLVNVNNLRIAPDAKVLRVVKKIVRGLYFHHLTPIRELPQVLSEDRVFVEPIFDPLPQAICNLSDWHAIHPDVFGYAFAECEAAGLAIPGVDSIWLLDALRGAGFLAVVTSNAFPLLGSL
jgi:hypothetical protein